MLRSKYFFMAAFLFCASNAAMANIVFCPATATCHDSQCHVDLMGSDWVSDDRVPDGIYYFAGAQEGTNSCRYKVPGERTTYMYFTGGRGLRASINYVGNKWTTSSINHGCNSENVMECPWTSDNG